MVGGWAAGEDGEDVEVRGLGGDFVSDHGGEPFADPHSSGGFGVVGVGVVVGGDGEFDSFTGQSNDAFFDGGISVSAISEGVGVRIAADPSLGGDFTMDF